MFGDVTNKSIREYAIKEYPNEMCGLVADGTFIPCENIHPKGTEHCFKIKDEDFIRVRNQYGKIDAIVHSHCCSRNSNDCYDKHHPSLEDQENQIKTQLPWGLTIVHGGWAYEVIWFGDQAPIQPLWGRRFVYGVWDCYAIIRDWFNIEKGIILPQTPREYGWWKSNDSRKAQNMYMDQFQELGFIEIPKPEKLGDVIIMQVGRADYPNHLAIYLEREKIGHQLQPFRVGDAKLSITEPIHNWKPYIKAVVRHKDLFHAA